VRSPRLLRRLLLRFVISLPLSQTFLSLVIKFRNGLINKQEDLVVAGVLSGNRNFEGILRKSIRFRTLKLTFPFFSPRSHPPQPPRKLPRLSPPCSRLRTRRNHQHRFRNRANWKVPRRKTRVLARHLALPRGSAGHRDQTRLAPDVPKSLR
jgi:hypothetical protein